MLIIGNWKMNGSAESLTTFFKTFQESSDAEVQIAVAPPYPYLPSLKAHGASIFMAAQDCSTHAGSGAFTGEVSAQMLADVGCTYVIVGHSERRQYFHETDQTVLTKTQNVLSAGMVPVICIGETLEQRKAGQTQDVLAHQLKLMIQHIAKEARVVIAYEPVWAIGTGLTPENAEIQEGCNFIARTLSDFSDVTVLYGGSVNGDNASEIFGNDAVQGALVGGASLKPHEFQRIIDSAKRRTNFDVNAVS